MRHKVYTARLTWKALEPMAQGTVFPTYCMFYLEEQLLSVQSALVSVRVQLQQESCNLVCSLCREQNCLLRMVSPYQVHEAIFCHFICVDSVQKESFELWDGCSPVFNSSAACLHGRSLWIVPPMFRLLLWSILSMDCC